MLEEFSSKNRARYKNLELVICDFKNMEFGEIDHSGVSRIQFLVVVGPTSLFSCWLSSEACS